MGFFGPDGVGVYGQILLYIQIVVALLLAAHILLKKHEPQVCMGWLLAVAMFPLPAGVFYLAFGINPFEKYAVRKRQSKALAELRRPKISPSEVKALNRSAMTALGFNNFERASDWIAQFNQRPLSTGNQIELLINSDVVYAQMRESISNARNFIFVQFYQIQADSVGIAFLDLLVEKAKQGVEVYVLYDALGSISLKTAMARHYREQGIKMNRFLEINPIKRRFQVNWRNHRKLVVVDGKEAFVGGFNIGKTYLQGPDPLRPQWVDLLFRVNGPTLFDLVLQFLEDWHFTTGELIVDVASRLAPVETEYTSHSLVTSLLSGPSENQAPFYSTVHNILFEANHRVWIMTPYFVPDRALLHAMRIAVSRGVHVRVIIPKESNHPMTDLCSSSYFSELNSYGIDLLRYQFGVCHGKVILADQDLVFAGSSNMDYRSFFLNFETDLFIRDKNIGQKIETFFEGITSQSLPLDATDLSAKPVSRLLIRRIMRLFAPLM